MTVTRIALLASLLLGPAPALAQEPQTRAEALAREREAKDRPLYAAELLAERAGVVGQAIAVADPFDLVGDLLVARARHVRVEVVLDLEAEVAAHQVEG